MLYFVVAIKIALVALCVVIVWNFYGDAEVRRIGRAKLVAFTLACAALGLAVNLVVSPNPVWTSEFLVSGTFSDDMTLLLLVFPVIVNLRMLTLLFFPTS